MRDARAQLRLFVLCDDRRARREEFVDARLGNVGDLLVGDVGDKIGAKYIVSSDPPSPPDILALPSGGGSMIASGATYQWSY